MVAKLLLKNALLSWQTTKHYICIMTFCFMVKVILYTAVFLWFMACSEITGLLRWLNGKERLQEMCVRNLGWEIPLRKAVATHFSWSKPGKSHGQKGSGLQPMGRVQSDYRITHAQSNKLHVSAARPISTGLSERLTSGMYKERSKNIPVELILGGGCWRVSCQGHTASKMTT